MPVLVLSKLGTCSALFFLQGNVSLGSGPYIYPSIVTTPWSQEIIPLLGVWRVSVFSGAHLYPTYSGSSVSSASPGITSVPLLPCCLHLMSSPPIIQKVETTVIWWWSLALA